MHTLNLNAIVLKRRNYSDADRFVTLFTLEQGKISVLAKGVRKMTSRKRPALEPASLIRISITGTTTSVPLVTQAQLIQSFPELKSNLSKLTQACQILEIIDILTAEEQAHPQIFNQSVYLLKQLCRPGNHKELIVDSVKYFLDELGFGQPEVATEAALKQHIEDIVNKSLKTKKYLTQTA
jgi:DNA repair protein RecO (recombination protein O)